MPEILGVGAAEAGLIVVAIGSLFVLRRVARVPSGPSPVRLDDEATAWMHARRSLMEALELRGFHVSDEDAMASRFVVERPDATVSVSWDARHREVGARLAWRDPASLTSQHATQDLARSAYTTACYLPREGVADRAIARLLEDLGTRLDDAKGV
jgi:hypothetical protein